MNQSTPSRSIPLPLWVTVGFYPFYLILCLGLCYWTWKAEGLFKISPYVFCMGILPFVVVGLLTGKPYGRHFAINVGGVALPLVGVALLVVWAKVRISVEREIFLAKETIPKGDVIRGDQFSTTRIRQFPGLDPVGRLPLVVAGKVARRLLPAGQPITAEELDDLKDVVQGETVHVQAIEGGARIQFDAIAQSSGQKGEIIMVHNPSSGRNFRALIEGREQVVVRGAL